MSDSVGFSRQEHWSGLPFPSPMCESEVSQSCPTLSNPMDCNLRGSSIHGIFQARVLEWGAIAFSPFLYWWLPNPHSAQRCYPHFYGLSGFLLRTCHLNSALPAPNSISCQLPSVSAQWSHNVHSLLLCLPQLKAQGPGSLSF